MFKKNPIMQNLETDTDMSSGAGFSDDDDMVIDMSEVSDDTGGFAVIPRGTYDAIVDDCTFGVSQRSGNKMLTWVLEITDADHAGRKLFYHSVLTPEQLPRLKKMLQRIAPEELTSTFSPKQVAESGRMCGKPLRVRVDIRKYEGSDRNNVKDVLPPSSEAEGGNDFL